MRRAVRQMAVDAVFRDVGVLKDKRSLVLHVTAGAGLSGRTAEQ